MMFASQTSGSARYLYCSIAYCKHECDGDDRPAMVGVGSALSEYMWRFLVPRYVLSLESERM